MAGQIKSFPDASISEKEFPFVVKKEKNFPFEVSITFVNCLTIMGVAMIQKRGIYLAENNDICINKNNNSISIKFNLLFEEANTAKVKSKNTSNGIAHNE